MGEMTSRLNPSAVTKLAGARWIPAVLCMWMALGHIAAVAAQPTDSAPAAQGTDTSVDARPRMRFVANGSTLEVFDAEAGKRLSSVAIPERIEFCQVVADVLLVALQSSGVAVVDLRDWRRPRRQADIATDTAIAWIDAAQYVAALHSRDGASVLEYDLRSPQAPRLMQIVKLSARSAASASACEHSDVTLASLRVITKRDGTQVIGQVRNWVPHEPVTVHTAIQGDVVIAWDDIRRIEELRSGPAVAPETVHRQPFQPIRSAPPPITDPRIPPILRTTGGVALTVVGTMGALVGVSTLLVAGSLAALESGYGRGLLGGEKTDFGPMAIAGAVSLGIGVACLGVGIYLINSNRTRVRVTSGGSSAAVNLTAGLRLTPRGLEF